MAPTFPVNRLVWVKAGGHCAFDGCRKRLIEDATPADGAAALGKVAHIVGHSEDRGPRSDKPVPGGERDGIANLMLLCPDHHDLVDRQPNTYTVERLVGMKEAHERWVREQLSPMDAGAPLPCDIEETLHSTLLEVDRMPMTVYTAPCDLKKEDDVKKRIRATGGDPPPMLPFILRSDMLITFTKLTADDNPFADVITGSGEPHKSEEWWSDKDYSNWYVTLLNRALNKLTGRRGLHLDKEHNRYYFEPERAENGSARAKTVPYRPLNKAVENRSVAWQPRRMKTRELKKHWIHLAVGLRFHKVTSTEWVLSIRPEHRFTKDGFEPLFPKTTGRRATRQKSHMYNINLLGDLQFWKEYLSKGEPRIIFDFGGQSLIVKAEMASTPIKWPGVPDDVKPFTNVVREEDLFTMDAYLKAIEQSEPDAELEFHELEDLAAMVDDAAEDLP